MEFYTIIFPDKQKDFIAWGLSFYDAEKCSSYADANFVGIEYAIALVIEEE